MEKEENQNRLKLIVPPASQTEDSIALIWNKPQVALLIESYWIYINQELIGMCQSTDYTMTHLQANKQYEIRVVAVNKENEVIIESDILQVKTKEKASLFNIVDYGAVGDGKTINTKAIQAAIDANGSLLRKKELAEDDCIAVKSGRDKEGRQIGIPTENVRITNCTFKSGFGVAIGSEMAAGVRNV